MEIRKQKKISKEERERKPMDPRQFDYTQTRNNIKSIEIDGVELFPMVKQIASKRWANNKRILYDDIVSSVLLALVQVVVRFDPKKKTKLSTYVYPRLFYGALDGMRREVRYLKKYEITEDLGLDEPDPTDLEEYVDTRILFVRVINVIEKKLTKKHAIALVRKYFESTGNDVIAKELGIPVDQVDSLLRSAIIEVRRYFPGVRI